MTVTVALVVMLVLGIAAGFLLSAAWRGTLPPFSALHRREATGTQNPASTPTLPAKDIVKLAWLADAPLFIDGEQVAAFYDAVVKPEAETKKITLSLKSLESEKMTLGGEAKVAISPAQWLTTVFPFLNANAEGKVQGSAETQRGKEETRTIELQPISSPQRQLVQLTLHYVLQLPHRIDIVGDPAASGWYDPKFVQALPRALIFLDFPAGTAFIPMAVELNDGKVVKIFEKAGLAFTRGKAIPQPDEKSLSGQRLAEAWVTYWKTFAVNFDSLAAMNTLEAEIAKVGGRIRWIDYRVSLPESAKMLDEGKTVHLHVSARGTYDTGVFAYNFIRRGYRHGIRLVGTLKSAPDINVLAVFEK